MPEEKKYVGDVGRDKLFLVVKDDALLLTRTYYIHNSPKKIRGSWKFSTNGITEELTLKLLPEETPFPIIGIYDNNSGSQYCWINDIPKYASAIRTTLFDYPMKNQYETLLRLGHSLTTKIFDEFCNIQIEKNDIRNGRIPLTEIEHYDKSIAMLYQTILVKPSVEYLSQRENQKLIKVKNSTNDV